MDTISRENNSMLPIGAIIVGGIGLLLGVLALFQVSKVNKAVAEQQTQLTERVNGFESQIASAAQAGERAERYAKALEGQVNGAFEKIGPIIGNLQASVTKLEDAAKRPVAGPSGKKDGAPVVAGPGEYIVKSGDTGMKIAGANNISVQDLMAVNPGVNWNSLRPGQKIKLPAKH